MPGPDSPDFHPEEFLGKYVDELMSREQAGSRSLSDQVRSDSGNAGVQVDNEFRRMRQLPIPAPGVRADQTDAYRSLAGRSGPDPNDPWANYSNLDPEGKQRLVEGSFPLWLKAMGAAAEHAPTLAAGEGNAARLAGMPRRPNPKNPARTRITPGDPNQVPQPIAPKRPDTRMPSEELARQIEAAKQDPAKLAELMRESSADSPAGELRRIVERVARRFAKTRTVTAEGQSAEPNVSTRDLTQEGLAGIQRSLNTLGPQLPDVRGAVARIANRDIGRASSKMRNPVSGVGEETPRERLLWAEIDKFSRRNGYEPSNEMLAIKLKDKAFTREEIQAIREGTPENPAKRGLAGHSLTPLPESQEDPTMMRLRDRLEEGMESRGPKSRVVKPEGENIPSTEGNPLDAMIAKEEESLRFKKFEQALGSLSPEQQKALKISQSGLPVAEAAAAAGMHPKTFQRRVAEAMEDLRAAVQGKAPVDRTPRQATKTRNIGGAMEDIARDAEAKRKPPIQGGSDQPEPNVNPESEAALSQTRRNDELLKQHILSRFKELGLTPHEVTENPSVPGKQYWYTDPVTGSTGLIRGMEELEGLPAHMEAQRAKFRGGNPPKNLGAAANPYRTPLRSSDRNHLERTNDIGALLSGGSSLPDPRHGSMKAKMIPPMTPGDKNIVKWGFDAGSDVKSDTNAHAEDALRRQPINDPDTIRAFLKALMRNYRGIAN